MLPLTYRAKRIVIVGDPNQLTPVVTLSDRDAAAVAATVEVNEAALAARNLSFTRDSAFTAYQHASGRAPVLLDEHYRCHPQIATWFNETFYSGTLRVLTDVTAQPGAIRGLLWVPVPGHTRSGPRGSAMNVEEVDAVVRWVLEHADEPGSLGVVTPFALQGTLIEQRLRAALGDEQYAARQVMVGTAHRFQGDERDIVLFSPVVADGAKPNSARWVEDQRNLVNVAVSRARRAVVVLADKSALAGLPVPTLTALVAAASGDTRAAGAVVAESRDVHSEAERRLYAAMLTAGMPVTAKPVVDGYELDFAIVTDGGVRIDVECDGGQHLDERGRQRRQDLARDHVLGKLGWIVLRVPAWRCLTDPDSVTADVADVARQTHPGQVS
jgi:very-short-patch-repair endonuclease